MTTSDWFTVKHSKWAFNVNQVISSSSSATIEWMNINWSVLCLWIGWQEVDEEVNEEESPGAATTAQSEEDLMQKKFQKLRQRNKSSAIYHQL